MIPPRYPDAMRAERIRKLLALEISRIVEDLDARRDFLLDVWSLHRKREPFLETMASRWSSLGFPMLAELTTEEVTVVDTFYREMDEFRLYMSFTQDMPTTLGDRYDWMTKRLSAFAALAVEALGGAPERPLVDFDDEAEAETASLLEFPQERARSAQDVAVDPTRDEGSSDPASGDASGAGEGPPDAGPHPRDR